MVIIIIGPEAAAVDNTVPQALVDWVALVVVEAVEVGMVQLVVVEEAQLIMEQLEAKAEPQQQVELEV